MLAQVAFSCFLINATVDEANSTLIANRTEAPCENIDYGASYNKVWPVAPPEYNYIGPTESDCKKNGALQACKNG